VAADVTVFVIVEGGGWERKWPSVFNWLLSDLAERFKYRAASVLPEINQSLVTIQWPVSWEFFVFGCLCFPGKQDMKLHGEFQLLGSENWSRYDMRTVEAFNFNSKWETWMRLATGMFIEIWREWRIQRWKKSPCNFCKSCRSPHVCHSWCLLQFKFVSMHELLGLNIIYINARVCVRARAFERARTRFPYEISRHCSD
jgi:hypothetical protein